MAARLSERSPLRCALGRGLAAGAVGVTALNAVTYLDMAVRARPTSSAPQDVLDVSAHKAGVEIPGDAESRDNRLQGLGPLLGIATGLAAGVVAALVRRWGSGISYPLTALVAGGTAMAGSDAPMAALGVTDPRKWSLEEWLADLLPHLGYGAATAAVLRMTE